MLADEVKNPLIVIEWGEDIRDAVKHFLKCLAAFQLLSRPLRATVRGREALVHAKTLRNASIKVVKRLLRWIYTGFKLFGADVRASYFLTKRVFKGYPLSVRERRLLVRTSRALKGL